MLLTKSFSVTSKHFDSGCNSLSQPEVVWSKTYSNKYPVSNTFSEGDGVNWVAPDGYIGHGFTLKLSDCRLNIAGIRLKNSCCERATRVFRVSGILEDGGPWVELLEGELADALTPASAPTLQTLHFKEAVQTQFLKFDVGSFWGAAGGLNFLKVITVIGNISCSFCFQNISNRLMRRRKRLQALLLWTPSPKTRQRRLPL